MKLVLQKITGFSCSDFTICVKNRNGKTLYFFENPKGEKISFNLICGEWFSENNLVELKKPLKYKTPKLAEPTLKRKFKKFVYEVGENPNKCTIDFSGKDAKVFIDEEINSQEIPHFIFVMFHENAHHFYGGKESGTKEYFEEENKCDTYAAKKMLERGFNPSQCLFAIEMCLSEDENARERKDKIYNWLKKVKVENENDSESFGKEISKTSFYTKRHEEKIPLVRIRTNDKNEMIHKTFGLDEGSEIYERKGNDFTEHKIRTAKKSEPFFVSDVVMVENDLLHPSTWKQGNNIFLVNGKEYVHFGSAQNFLDVIPILEKRLENGIEKVKEGAKEGAKKIAFSIVEIFLFGLLAYMLFNALIKKL